jgi:glucose-1-phosphate thymidylyltransferase
MEGLTGLIWATEGASCPFAASGPRQLVPIGNEPLLFHTLDALRASGVDEAVVLVSPETEAPIRAAVADGRRVGLRTTCVRAAAPAAWAEALRSAANVLGARPCIVQHEDGVLKGDLRAHTEEIAHRPSDALVLVHPPAGGNRVDGINGRRLLRLLDPSPTEGLAPTGVCLLGGGLLGRLRDELAPGRDGSFGGVLARIVAGRGRLEAREVAGWWRYTESGAALLEANHMVLDDIRSDWEGATWVDSQVQGRVVAHPSAVLESTIVRGPAVIGPGARVRHSYIGPYTAIGEGARVDGAEIESSIILSRAVIRHLGQRLEESVVGAGTKVHRDFALPTALRVRVGEKQLISLPY